MWYIQLGRGYGIKYINIYLTSHTLQRRHVEYFNSENNGQDSIDSAERKI